MGQVVAQAGRKRVAAGVDEALAEQLDLDDAGGVTIAAETVVFSDPDLAARVQRWWDRRPAYIARSMEECAADLGVRAAGVARRGSGGRIRGVRRMDEGEAVGLLGADAPEDGSMVVRDLQGNWWLVSAGGDVGDGVVAGGRVPVSLWEVGRQVLLLGTGMEEIEGPVREVYCPRVWSEASLLAARMVSGMVAQSVCSRPAEWENGQEVTWNGAWRLLDGYLEGLWGFPVVRCWRGEWRYFGSVGGDDALLAGGGVRALEEDGWRYVQEVNSVVLAEAGRILVADLAATEGHVESAMEWRGMSGSPDEEHVSALVAWAEGSSVDVVRRSLWTTLWLCGVDRGPGMRLGARVLGAALERRSD